MNDWAEFRHFRYLLTILEKQGFRAAADELNTSQPNLTIQARQFQENGSIRLFKRSRTGRIRPTETGIAFIALARFLLTTRNEVIEALRAVEQGEIRSVRLGCSPWVDQSLFRTFTAMHKEIVPNCVALPTHDDTAHLAEDVLNGLVDAAVVTLPLEHPDLQVAEIQRERLVVCLWKDDPMARRSMLRIADLQGKLSVLYHPRRHPDAHERLLELLEDEGLCVADYSHASNPFELQMLVKEGHGLALIREGGVTDPGLTTRAIAGVTWTVDTAVIYRRDRHPKTVPVLVSRLKQHCQKAIEASSPKANGRATQGLLPIPKKPAQSARPESSSLNQRRKG